MLTRDFVTFFKLSHGMEECFVGLKFAFRRLRSKTTPESLKLIFSTFCGQFFYKLPLIEKSPFFLDHKMILGGHEPEKGVVDAALTLL